MIARTLQRLVRSVPSSDGAGVRLLRSLGQPLGPRQALRVDPFLLLDEFSSENPDDYVAGFPAHPHRGFETITYMLDGHMLHEDHLGNRGDLKSGGVQWMTAGRGIVHSEMPQQMQGRMRGFQLWLNLPAREKMREPEYVDLQPERIPEVSLPGGGLVRVVAGTLTIDGDATSGPIAGRSTEPVYFDVRLPAGAHFEQALPAGHNAFVYPYEGRVNVGPADAMHALDAHAAGVLSETGPVRVEAIAQAGDSRFLLIAGRPIGEPVVQYGPFVMNTTEEIEQALRDFRDGSA
ncbi:MAG TPA: pirin family protein [Zeimonas sp.]